MKPGTKRTIHKTRLRALDTSAGIDELGQEFWCCGGNWGPAIRVTENDETTVVGINDDCASLLTNQESAQVVPRPVRVPRTVDVAVDDATSNRAQVKCTGTE
jgi:hypothetical protein